MTIPPVGGVEALRFLMGERGLTRADLAPLVGARSLVSEALAGKCRRSRAHIARLAGRFGVPADMFIGRKYVRPCECASSWRLGARPSVP